MNIFEMDVSTTVFSVTLLVTVRCFTNELLVVKTFTLNKLENPRGNRNMHMPSEEDVKGLSGSDPELID